ADAITCSAAVSACEKASEWQRALQVLRANLDVANVVTYSAAISACEKAAEWRTALALLEEAERGSFTNVVTYSAAVSACEKAQWSVAVRVSFARASMLAVAFHMEAEDTKLLLELFRGLDLNGDGLLTTDEFSTGVRSMGVDPELLRKMVHCASWMKSQMPLHGHRA
ncbi:unnamed protein product, partial [Effrenium voratum]